MNVGFACSIGEGPTKSEGNHCPIRLIRYNHRVRTIARPLSMLFETLKSLVEDCVTRRI